MAAILQRDAAAALAAFDTMMGTVLGGDTLQLALGRAAPHDEPLGAAFSEDLHWNLTRLIGPMAEVLIPEAAEQLGHTPATLTPRELGAYLSTVGRQLPAGKQTEWQALSELLVARYGKAGPKDDQMGV